MVSVFDEQRSVAMTLGLGTYPLKIVSVETYLANAGLRNYLFIRLRTDTGLTGIGEATLEWQEKTVQTLLHEWVESRVIGRDPFNVEANIGGLIRDQYQGGSTVMTAISAVEIACWDLIGKACNQPVYRLLGGRYHERIPAYANGWYGGAQSPAEFAHMALEAVGEGLQGAEVRPVWNGVEDARTVGSGSGDRHRRGRARGGRFWRRLDDRVSWTACRRGRVQHDPPARTVPTGLVRRAGRARVPRSAGGSRSARPAVRLPRGNVFIPRPTSIG